MNTVSFILIIIVAVEHLYFLVLEMFLWTKPKGIKTFGLKSKEFAEETKVLAANQGLYNGFISAGLLYSIYENNSHFTIFFLICVSIAGIYGAYSTNIRRLFYVQSIPAILALTALLINI
jgi:putative membrane protein